MWALDGIQKCEHQILREKRGHRMIHKLSLGQYTLGTSRDTARVTNVEHSCNVRPMAHKNVSIRWYIIHIQCLWSTWGKRKKGLSLSYDGAFLRAFATRGHPFCSFVLIFYCGAIDSLHSQVQIVSLYNVSHVLFYSEYSESKVCSRFLRCFSNHAENLAPLTRAAFSYLVMSFSKRW